MRALLAAIVAITIAGSATASTAVPAKQRIAVYDHKYGVTRYAIRSVESNFVGTNAKAQKTKKKLPSWYVFGHP